MSRELLSRKELAAALKRSRQYVWAMEKAGFKVIGGMSTLEEAGEWLARNPPPMARKKTA